VKNENRRFNDDWVELEMVQPHPVFGQEIKKGEHFKLPVAHGDGRFYAPAEDLKRIYDQELVWLKYLKNPNGSMGDIAGVMNEKRNVVGLMPHPERAIAEWMGGMAGWGFL
jgi:phosphoribosylformylglycinamidine synthase